MLFGGFRADQQTLVASAVPENYLAKALEHYRRVFDLEDWTYKADKCEYNEARPVCLVAELRLSSGLICFGSVGPAFSERRLQLARLPAPA